MDHLGGYYISPLNGDRDTGSKRPDCLQMDRAPSARERDSPAHSGGYFNHRRLGESASNDAEYRRQHTALEANSQSEGHRGHDFPHSNFHARMSMPHGGAGDGTNAHHFAGRDGGYVDRERDVDKLPSRSMADSRSESATDWQIMRPSSTSAAPRDQVSGPRDYE
jgi:hypothetical protein